MREWGTRRSAPDALNPIGGLELLRRRCGRRRCARPRGLQPERFRVLADTASRTADERVRPRAGRFSAEHHSHGRGPSMGSIDLFGRSGRSAAFGDLDEAAARALRSWSATAAGSAKLPRPSQRRGRGARAAEGATDASRDHAARLAADAPTRAAAARPEVGERTRNRDRAAVIRLEWAARDDRSRRLLDDPAPSATRRCSLRAAAPAVLLSERRRRSLPRRASPARAPGASHELLSDLRIDLDGGGFRRDGGSRGLASDPAGRRRRTPGGHRRAPARACARSGTPEHVRNEPAIEDRCAATTGFGRNLANEIPDEAADSLVGDRRPHDIPPALLRAQARIWGCRGSRDRRFARAGGRDDSLGRRARARLESSHGLRPPGRRVGRFFEREGSTRRSAGKMLGASAPTSCPTTTVGDELTPATAERADARARARPRPDGVLAPDLGLLNASRRHSAETGPSRERSVREAARARDDRGRLDCRGRIDDTIATVFRRSRLTASSTR